MAGCGTDPLSSDAGADAARDVHDAASSGDGGRDARPAIDATTSPDANALDGASAPDAIVAGSGPGYSDPLVSRGGPILAHPSFVTITYADDANRTAMEAYGAAMAAETAWWSATTSEYGVGPLVSLGNVRLTDVAPMAATQAEVETYLLGLATAGTLPRAADGTYDGVIYLLYLPGGARVTLSDGAMACGGWHGVHGEARTGSTRIVYALAVECGPSRGFTHLGYLEAAASHELVEAATDPYTDTMPAYASDPRVAEPWSIFGETTDRCVGQYLQQGADVFARSWSNVASLAGTPPCVPVPSGEVYYGVYTPMTTLHGAPGTTLEVPITGFARATVPDFRVTVRDYYGAAVMPTLDVARLNEGVSTTMHLTLPASARAGSASWVLLNVGPASNDTRNYPLLVIYD
jgi:hypothetical protein